jgi:predicted transcriptional regulator
VREVQNTLNETKETGYTTVLKMMQLMTEKGMVERDETAARTCSLRHGVDCI